MLPSRIPTAREIAKAIPLEKLADLVAERIADEVEVPLDELTESVMSVFDYDMIEIDYENIEIDYDKFDIEYDELAREVDHSDVASELAYSHIGAHEVAEQLADSFEADDIAEHICLSSLASEIDISDLAESFSDRRMKQVADFVSCAELAKHVQDPWSMMVTPFQENKEA
jgi:hypothetical protein